MPSVTVLLGFILVWLIYYKMFDWMTYIWVCYFDSLVPFVQWYALVFPFACILTENCPQIVRLARKLPTGDLSELKADASKDGEEPLDENDLT